MICQATSTPLSRRVAIALFPVAVLLACGPQAEPTKAGPDQSYEVRGEIVRLPEAGTATPEIWIRHEAIPEFATEDGKKVGMDSMTMPFALAPGLSLDGLAIGDKVAFTLEVRWSDRAAPARLSRLAKLPAETLLSLEAQQGR